MEGEGLFFIVRIRKYEKDYGEERKVGAKERGGNRIQEESATGAKVMERKDLSRG